MNPPPVTPPGIREAIASWASRLAKKIEVARDPKGFVVLVVRKEPKKP